MLLFNKWQFAYPLSSINVWSERYLGFMYSYVILVHRGPFWLQHCGLRPCLLASVFPMFRPDEAARAARSPLLVGTLRGPHHSFVTLLCFAVQSPPAQPWFLWGFPWATSKNN